MKLSRSRHTRVTKLRQWGPTGSADPLRPNRSHGMKKMMFALPLKMLLRWTADLSYVLSMPEYYFNF